MVTEIVNIHSNSDINIQIGARIEYTGYYGTVLYKGPVENYQGEWLGVEWDDPSRGKHDGSVAGFRYFQTSHPTSGSFIRPSKVQTGRSAAEAIASRYGQVESDSEATLNQIQLLNVQKEINAPFLELVGFDKINEKQSKFNDLRVVSLRLEFVNGPGEVGELQRICPKVVELDLSKNLLSKWNDIFIMCEQLKNLRWLNVSENCLEFPEEITVRFPSVQSLICGYMKLQWHDILKIAEIFPSLEELRLPYNFVSKIELSNDEYFQSLKILNIEGNIMEDCNYLGELGNLRNLEQLLVVNTNLALIQFEPCAPGEKLKKFINLKQLVISDNLINNWESIGELNKLPVLEDLRFQKNPILDSEKPSTCTQLIIAKIGNLKILNGTFIKTDERKGAEYDYIKKYGLEWFEVAKDETLKQYFLQRHPRYTELLQKYGEPEESELVFTNPSLKTSLTAVNIYCEDKIISKKIPRSMTLQKLIFLIQKLFKLTERPNLYYVSNSQPEVEVEMNDEFKDIGYYSIQNGDNIYVRLS